jgi:hypothetical protein
MRHLHCQLHKQFFLVYFFHIFMYSLSNNNKMIIIFFVILLLFEHRPAENDPENSGRVLPLVALKSCRLQASAA